MNTRLLLLPVGPTAAHLGSPFVEDDLHVEYRTEFLQRRRDNAIKRGLEFPEKMRQGLIPRADTFPSDDSSLREHICNQTDLNDKRGRSGKYCSSSIEVIKAIVSQRLFLRDL